MLSNYRNRTGQHSGFKWNPFAQGGEAPAMYRFFPGEGEGEGDKKYFTQEEVNRFMAEHKKSLQQENAQLKKELEEAKKALQDLTSWKDEMEELLEEAADELDEGGEADEPEEDLEEDDSIIARGTEETKKAVEYVNRKWEKRMKQLEKRIEEAENQAHEAEEKRLASERDSILTAALQKADAVSIAHGLKLFRDNLIYDQDDGKWVFRTEDGLDLTPEEGIKEHLPPFLKRTEVKAGSGATDMKGAQLAAHIEELKKRVATAEAKARQTNASEDLRAYQRAKAELKTFSERMQQQSQR